MGNRCRPAPDCFPDNLRDVTSLQKKFQELYKKKIPTSDPTCLPEVRRAKLAQKRILARDAAADISKEAGGFQGATSNIASLRSETEAELTDSSGCINSTGSMIKKCRASPPQLDPLQVYMMQQQQQAKQDREDRKMEREERRKSREMFMGLLAAGISAFGGDKSVVRQLLKKKQKSHESKSDSKSE